ncbi:hypothetical protein SASPL_126914 [Salvia splendens]|uniref:No apical meristem-associated C-terminal domain-containing protein n=1 Tax=Salvia splendens TaxID=180675 RepID=A0A8X8XMQ1_SALSN|nr:hypothetical protein SASPL_126914 [Salvia splendens]
MSVRQESYTENEYILLCKVYMEISQDPGIGTSQSAQRFWQRVENGFNQAEERDPTWPESTQRSMQARIQAIEKATKKFHGCIRAAEARNRSGASNVDINSHDLKTVKEENKIMAMDLSSIVDPDSRAYFQAERRRILQKIAQQQEQPNDYATGTYPSYFDNIGGSGSGLPDY